MALRAAVDVGGTFTDLVVLDKNWTVQVAKPHDFSTGIMKSLAEANVSAEDVASFVHGSTIIINTLTERKGAKVGLITTLGFRDVLEIGRANRPDLYNLTYKKPPAFVPRHLRVGVKERMLHTGEVLTPLDEASVRATCHDFEAHGVEAIAVCFLHSYANPAHEVRVGEILQEELPDVPFTLSHELSPEWREYERTNTVVFNSYCLPVSMSYVSRLEERLEDYGIPASKCRILQSNGGTLTLPQAASTPMKCCESGPVAGVIGASIIGKIIGEDKIITIDFGGTTTKSSLIDSGEPRIITDYYLEHDPTVAKYPIRVPTIDIVEIGSGGGSYAWVDDYDNLQVGPRSQGADPGPACYSRGGDKATVCDADLVCGRLNPEYFCGGTVEVDVEKSVNVIEEIRTAYDSNLSVDEMASGMIRLADASMVAAIKQVSVRRGYDTSDFSVVAMGGNGPLHASAISQYLNVKRIIVPLHAGVFSSYGMLLTDLRKDNVQTKIVRLDLEEEEEAIETIQIIENEFALMETKALDDLDETQLATVILRRFADLRYSGQEHTVKVPLPMPTTTSHQGAGITKDVLIELIERFHELHERDFSFRLESSKVEIVNFHLQLLVPKDVTIDPMSSEGKSLEAASKGTRMVYFHDYGRVETKIFERGLMPPSNEWIEGPMVVEEMTATTVVYPFQKLKVDEYGFLHIEENEEYRRERDVAMTSEEELNPFTLEIVKDSLLSISEEMFVSTQRTSMSTIIYEVLDFATGITDSQGRLVSQGNGVTLFIGLLADNIRHAISKHEGNIHDGDVFINNDPYVGGGTHLSDVSLVKPVFYEGEIVGWAGNKAHWTEVGGKQAGSWSTDATEIYQEGLRFPCIKIYSKGVRNEDLVQLIEANVRTPRESIGDMSAQIGCLGVATKRIHELLDRWGKDVYLKAIDKILEDGRKSAMVGMSKLPKGVWEATDMIDDDGIGNGPFEVRVQVTITDDEFIADFTGTSGQVPGPINCGVDACATAARAVFKALTNTDLSQSNEGVFSPMRIILPPKTIFSAVEPAPVSTYWETMMYASEIIWRALAGVVPHKVTAGHFLSVCGLSAWGFNPDGSMFILVEPQAGGWGAGPNKDGENGLVCIGDGETYIIPVEVAEIKYGIRVNQFALDIRDDSSGVGRRRGGRGLIREYECVSDYLVLGATFGRHKFKPWAFGEGAKEGSNNYVVVEYDGAREAEEEGEESVKPESEVFGKCAGKKLLRGDRALLYTATGGGWGHPFEREVELVQSDVLEGYITLESAERDYGVVLRKEGVNYILVEETEARLAHSRT